MKFIPTNFQKQRDLAQLFSSFLGHYKFYKNQSECVFNCPSCGKPKFSVNFRKRVAHCWRCADLSYGNIYFFLKEHFPEHLSEYIQILKSGSDYSYSPEEIEHKEPPKEIDYPPFYLPIDNSLMSRPYLTYLYNRNLSQQIIDYYEIGYCVHGPYYDRVVIPSKFWNNELNYFTCRAIYPNMEPSYLNSSVDKTSIIFNESKIKDVERKPLVLAEGIFDILAIEQSLGNSDYNYSVLLGKYLSDTDSALMDLIIQNKPQVILALDNDAIQDAKNIAKIMIKWGVEVFFVFPPKNIKDFGMLCGYDDKIKELFKNPIEFDEFM